MFLARQGVKEYPWSDGAREPVAERFSGATSIAGFEKLIARLRTSDRVAMECCAYVFNLAKKLIDWVGCEVYVLNTGQLAIIDLRTVEAREENWKLLEGYTLSESVRIEEELALIEKHTGQIESEITDDLKNEPLTPIRRDDAPG